MSHCWELKGLLLVHWGTELGFTGSCWCTPITRVVWRSQSCSYSSFCNSSVNTDSLSFHIGIRSAPEFWGEFCLLVADGVCPDAPNCLTQYSSIACVFVCALICLECCGQNDPCANTAVNSYFYKLGRSASEKAIVYLDELWDAQRGTAELYPEAWRVPSLCCCCVHGWTAWPPEGISHTMTGCGMEAETAHRF